jgi:RNA polymerase sigma factor (sigma-70 family)
MGSAGIPSTHPSLLKRLQSDSATRAEDWRTFFERYQPVIVRWCRRWKLQFADIEDVSANVFLKLCESIQTYEHRPDSRFRSWLRTVVSNTVINEFRSRARHPGDHGSGDSDINQALQEIEDSSAKLADELDERIAADWQRIQDTVKAQVEENTWQAFWLTKHEGRPAAEVAAQLGMGRGAVYQAAYRVTALIRDAYAALQKPAEETKEGSP